MLLILALSPHQNANNSNIFQNYFYSENKIYITQHCVILSQKL